jgi:hypothetical protein
MAMAGDCTGLTDLQSLHRRAAMRHAAPLAGCNHSHLLASCDRAPSDAPLSGLQWFVVAVIPARSSLLSHELAAIHSPPRHAIPIDPILLSIRV